jgi:hypothetical protein
MISKQWSLRHKPSTTGGATTRVVGYTIDPEVKIVNVECMITNARSNERVSCGMAIQTDGESSVCGLVPDWGRVLGG